jgi:hypothetical protein
MKKSIEQMINDCKRTEEGFEALIASYDRMKADAKRKGDIAYFNALTESEKRVNEKYLASVKTRVFLENDAPALSFWNTVFLVSTIAYTVAAAAIVLLLSVR